MAASNAKTTRDIAYVAVFAALIIVFAFVSIPTASGVPIVLQNAVILLSGLVLGARRGFLATLLVLVLGLIGLPVLAGGRSTLVAMAGPTAGYVVGYLVAVIVVGLIAYRAPRSKPAMVAFFAVAGVVGLALQYLFGIFGLMIRAHMTFNTALVAQLPFIGPDLLKVAVMVFVAIGVHMAFPDLIPRGRR